MFEPKSFKIIIDNIDMAIKPCYMRVDIQKNQSLHYANSYSVQGRVNFNHLSYVHSHGYSNSPDKNALQLLPSLVDDKEMRSLFMMHVTRILVIHTKYSGLFVMGLWSGM